MAYEWREPDLDALNADAWELHCAMRHMTKGRGPGHQIGHDNREAVRKFFAEHIGCTNVECAAALGLSVMAVGRHIKTLRQEWSA